MNPKVDFYFNKASQWQKEYTELRKIILDCGLTEELKWGCPCYTVDDKNVVLIHGFKEYCAILFMKGALMKDTKAILIQQTENVQSARQLRFTSANEIIMLKATIKAYVNEAIKIERSGLKVELKKTGEYEVPEEFQSKLDKDKNLRSAFEALTPGRQRAYIYYFSQAKQSKTREARVDKYIPQILDGKGLED
ncbi:hypothetical protein CJD36_022295 [Flavipsychrobacter stenotrophus]|uniref:YdhG-like domain-containing protein n=1 Tax=Flavipsychrobacter stenotrophus TaxID=2077091 RepID=A0A2S7SQ87_9BACT|nr:YdeI/OmpD-associated family protein [Flavipsychrobacter stenotrophus]PQJ08787.1 hypothetical protein CJD36_022295 [Flavipsychrobacter stenotrophus]